MCPIPTTFIVTGTVINGLSGSFEEIEIGDVYNENEDELLETIEELEKEVKFYLSQGNKTAAKLIQQQIKDIKKVHF